MPKKNKDRRRKQHRFYRRSKPGAVPGTIVSLDDASPTTMHYVAFSSGSHTETSLASIDDLPKSHEGVRWLDVRGLADTATLKAIAREFGLHPLAMEDVVNVHQRPKVDTYDNHLFIVTRSVLGSSLDNVALEQLSMFLGPDFVVTFQERPDDSFAPVRKRIRSKWGQIRNSKSDYLAYALLDMTIDRFFPIVEQLADRIDILEDSVDQESASGNLGSIHAIRNELLALRRCVRPQRDALNELIRSQHPLVSEGTRIYLRDCHDHASQLLDSIEVYREMCSSLRDYQMSMISNRMNEIMKVLTVISTIFIPLSFIAGVYGMNFNTSEPGNMPELNVPYGYVGVLGIMALIGGGMISYFWRRGWLGRR